MKGIIKDNRRLSEGDGMSLERESFKVIQNQANQTFDVPDKPSSARLSRLKDMKSKKLANLDRNNSFEGYFLSNYSNDCRRLKAFLDMRIMINIMIAFRFQIKE